MSSSRDPLDTAAVRDRAGTSYNTWSDYEVQELCDEIDALRARLDAVREAVGTFRDDCGRERHWHCIRLEDVAAILAVIGDDRG